MKLYEELVGNMVRYWVDESGPAYRRVAPWVALEVPDDGAPVLMQVVQRIRSRYPILGLDGALALWRSRQLVV